MVEYKILDESTPPVHEQLKPPLVETSAEDESMMVPEHITSKEWASRDQRVLIHGNQLPTIDPRDIIVFEKAKGSSYWDVNGIEYVDATGGTHNNHVGHGREEIAQAVAEQMTKLEFALNISSFSHIPAIECAERILTIARKEFHNMERVFFTSGGSEAVEVAIHCCLKYWQLKGQSAKKRIISFKNCYHGTTFMSSSLSEETREDYGMKRVSDEKGESCLPLSIDFPHEFLIGSHHTNAGFFVAEQLEDLIKNEGPDTIAAFIVEPVQGFGGCLEPHKDFFALARQICDRYGILMIDDEVMTGFGKTGKWFSLSHYGINPDIVVFSKGVSSGYLPFGGMVISSQMVQMLFSHHEALKFDYTLSGHPCCCVAAMKNLDIIENEDLVERANEMGKIFRSKLFNRLSKFKLFGGLTGLGLMIGILLNETLADKMVHLMVHQHHIIVTMGAKSNNTIILTPALMIEEEKMDIIVDGFEKSFRALTEEDIL